ncbi:MAG: oxygenase MpaB family protein [Acidimicrobiia bacterium]|nr:oxygenase MpaB family protein [Acidimicrobiia bacterium]
MPLNALRSRIIGATTGLFAHAPYPLDSTGRYRNDPGLFGPQSVSWPVIGDAAAFVGGIRALLVQAAHPEVAAGVFDHSRYREDPLGRLSRTSAYVTATAYGAIPEVERAINIVRRAHRPIQGESHRGIEYSASAAPLAAWVHNALTDSFLAAYRHFGARPLTQNEADRFVAEQTRVGALMGAAPLPDTEASLAEWVDELPELGRSPGMAEAITFLRSPPLPGPVRPAYRVLFEAAVVTLPPRILSILDLPVRPGARRAGLASVQFLRWALGSSPSWLLALDRIGAPIPEGLFRQPLPSGKPSVIGSV